MVNFDADTHIYTDESGIVLSSVTNILAAEGLATYFNQDPWYMERGRAIHACCEFLDKKVLACESVDPAIAGFLDAYQKFLYDTEYEFEHIEEPLSHPIYKYAGTPDRFLPLLDIKGAQGNILQLEGYAELLRANKINPGREAYTLHLKEDGTYKLETHKLNRQLLGVFLSAVTIHNYKRGANNGKY